MQRVQWKAGPVLFNATTVMTLLRLTACGPAALEEKRRAERCNATYGRFTPEAFACLEAGVGRFAMHVH
ncbi:MAG: hypothetical protein IH881_15570 [Myxococcales bacterium]|nr:hypothetical protein [Myxococcales bacterium]